MSIKAVAFDIGHTLVRYNSPLNWKALYRPALTQMLDACGANFHEKEISAASAVLSRYNTRENPREIEVTSDVIFTEIFQALQLPLMQLDTAKRAFYGFFSADTACYDDAANTLKTLHEAGLKTGALTDVAYGMDNRYSLRDIADIRPYLDIVLTSVDVGYRKPHKAGFLKLLTAFDIAPQQMMYVGDEQKDIDGANACSIVSVLIDRNQRHPHWGQTHTVQSLSDIVELQSQAAGRR